MHALSSTAPIPRHAARRNGRQLLRANLRPLALAAAGLFAQASGQAAGPVLPSGWQVMPGGQATVATRGGAMTVTSSANAVLNWQQFSIGAGQSVRFDQPSASSKVLNRVVGQDASQIFGSLSSNGAVWLLNPNGVLFGAGARVDVAGLMASTLSISNADWAAGRYSLAGSADGLFGSASVVNQGQLRTVAGGRVMLVGGATVRNEGLIDAPGGQVLLAAGRSVDLVDSALPNLAVRVSAPQGEVLNLGQVLAAGGRIDLSAAIVNQRGIVRADSLGAGLGGQIQLLGSQGVDLGAASLTSASGGSGGRVLVDGGSGSTLLAGRLSATGGRGAGGGVQMLGRQVGLLDGATVDASGAAGGTVQIGGGLQGRDAGLRNAEAVYMAPGASVAADALGSGAGGLIVLWSDQATRAYGSLSARGGPLGGDGGLIETSGGWLDARPASVRTDAPAGRHGQWLLDPHDIVITSDASDFLIAGNPDFRSTGNVAVLSTATLEAALNANNNVTVTTSSGGGNGDIRVLNASLRPAPSSAVSLTLNADRNITFDFSTVRSEGAALSLALNAGRGSREVGPGADNSEVGGAVAIRSSTLDLRGGRLDIGGAVIACGANQCSRDNVGAVASDHSVLRDGILIAASSIDVGSGRITLRGHSVAELGEASGIALVDGSALTAAAIDLRGTVDSNGPYARTGVKLAGGVITASRSLSINGAAYSGVYRDSNLPTGVDVLGELRVGVADQPGEASLSITGLSRDGDRVVVQGLPVLRRFGVGIRGATAKLVALGGANILVNGIDNSNNADLGILAAGSASAYIDASAGSQLRFDATGDLKLSGDVRLPVAGPVSLSASGTLAIDRASLSGEASQVDLAGTVVSIGGQGESTQLVFGANTAVRIQARQFRIGVSGFGLLDLGNGNPPPGPPTNQGLPPPQADLPDRRALADAPAPGALAQLSTGGSLTVAADSVVIGTGAQLRSDASGDALVLRGGEGGTLSSFANFGGANVLQAPNGRWLLLAGSPDNDAGRFFLPDALRPDYRAFGITAGNPLLPQAGNGFLFTAQPLLSLNGQARRSYDGTDSFDLNSLEVGLLGLLGGDRITGTWHTADKRVGSQKPLALRAQGTGLVDENGAPVYGYRLDSESMVARIDARLLSVASFSAQDKTYDGNTTATVGGLQLSGVIAGDAVSPNAGGQFNNKQVGQNKPVALTSLTLSGADAANYEAQLPDFGVTATIRTKAVTISNAADGPLGSKVYDGNTVAPTVDGQRLAIAGLVAGDQVSASASGGNFADKRAGSNKQVTLTGVALSGNDAGNYSVNSATSRADITPLAISVVATTAADKVYDGGTAASAASVALAGVLEGDLVVGRGNGQFVDKAVGAAKPLTIDGFSLSGSDAANYRLLPAAAANLSAAITPATLVYRADAATASTGSPLPPLSGRVSGLLGDDTLANATTGQLAFTTPATPTAEPGRYAITGSGLAAGNYVFSQAPANATALLLVPPPVVLPPPQDVTTSQVQALAIVLPPPAATSAASGRALDAVQVVLPGAPADKQAFANLDLANLSQDTLAAVLAARDQYKKAVFQQAISRLEQNPGLADAPGCATAQQAAAGQCLMISPINQGLAISNARVVDLAAGVAPPPPTAAPAPAQASAAAPAAPAPAQALPSPAPAPQAAVLAAAPPAVAYRLPVRRSVKAATLPQIQRKIAILIGIDEYRDARIPRLGNAVRDAQAVAESLETHLGYETVVLENPDRATIFKVLNQLAVEVGPADSVVLYYAGHGELVEKTGQGYWQPADADATRPETWVANADIDRLLKQLPASQSAMISDSCFSGGLVTGERIRGTSATQDPGALLTRRAAVVMTSGGNEPVFDSGKNGHSPFAYSLMQSLAQVNNWRPGSTLFEQVRFAVSRQLPQRPQYGASRSGGHESGADYLFEQRQLEGGRK